MARNRRRYRRLVGNGPWICRVCGEDVIEIGRRRDQGHVHHLNENETDDDPDNLCVLHADCHNIIHQTGRPSRVTPQGGTHSWGHKISKGLKGHHGARASQTPEGRQKFREIALAHGFGEHLNSVLHRCECGFETTNAGSFARWHRAKGHKEVMPDVRSGSID